MPYIYIYIYTDHTFHAIPCHMFYHVFISYRIVSYAISKLGCHTYHTDDAYHAHPTIHTIQTKNRKALCFFYVALRYITLASPRQSPDSDTARTRKASWDVKAAPIPPAPLALAPGSSSWPGEPEGINKSVMQGRNELIYSDFVSIRI